MTKRFRQNGENMDILNEAKKNFDYMVRIRRHMHEYPENSGVEYETVKYIASELDALGIEYVVVPEGGIIGQIHGGKPGKTVLLRADTTRNFAHCASTGLASCISALRAATKSFSKSSARALLPRRSS